jgi:hypothetical protein
MKFMSNIKTEVWVAWLGATVVAAVTMTFILLTYAYAQFETKDHAKEREADITTQLSKMDKKLNILLGLDEAGVPIRRPNSTNH